MPSEGYGQRRRSEDYEESNHQYDEVTEHQLSPQLDDRKAVTDRSEAQDQVDPRPDWSEVQDQVDPRPDRSTVYQGFRDQIEQGEHQFPNRESQTSHYVANFTQFSADLTDTERRNLASDIAEACGGTLHNTLIPENFHSWVNNYSDINDPAVSERTDRVIDHLSSHREETEKKLRGALESGDAAQFHRGAAELKHLYDEAHDYHTDWNKTPPGMPLDDSDEAKETAALDARQSQMTHRVRDAAEDGGTSYYDLAPGRSFNDTEHFEERYGASRAETLLNMYDRGGTGLESDEMADFRQKITESVNQNVSRHLDELATFRARGAMGIVVAEYSGERLNTLSAQMDAAIAAGDPNEVENALTEIRQLDQSLYNYRMGSPADGYIQPAFLKRNWQRMGKLLGS